MSFRQWIGHHHKICHLISIIFIVHIKINILTTNFFIQINVIQQSFSFRHTGVTMTWYSTLSYHLQNWQWSITCFSFSKPISVIPKLFLHSYNGYIFINILWIKVVIIFVYNHNGITCSKGQLSFAYIRN